MTKKKKILLIFAALFWGLPSTIMFSAMGGGAATLDTPPFYVTYYPTDYIESIDLVALKREAEGVNAQKSYIVSICMTLAPAEVIYESEYKIAARDLTGTYQLDQKIDFVLDSDGRYHPWGYNGFEIPRSALKSGCHLDRELHSEFATKQAGAPHFSPVAHQQILGGLTDPEFDINVGITLEAHPPMIRKNWKAIYELPLAWLLDIVTAPVMLAALVIVGSGMGAGVP